MFKNYLLHNGQKFFRGQYKTPATALRWGKIDLQHFLNKCNVIGKPASKESKIIIAFNGETIATIQ